MPEVFAYPHLTVYQQMLSGQLPPANKAALLPHLESCDACAQKIGPLLKQDTMVELVRQVQSPDDSLLGEKAIARLLVLSLCFAGVILSVGVLVWSFWPGREPLPPAAEAPPPRIAQGAPAGKDKGLQAKPLREPSQSGPVSDSDIATDPNPRIRIGFDYTRDKLKQATIGTSMRFGVMMVDPGNPNDLKRLTYDFLGRSNSTVLRSDGNTRVFGKGGGSWQPAPEIVIRQGRTTATATWWMPEDNVQVTQRVEVIPGQAHMDKKEYKRLLDTALVRYSLENKGARPRKVGLRILVDTALGLRPDGLPNDGVPFTVPGEPSLISFRDFKTAASVPDFIQMLETGDLKNPGMIGQMNLKLGGRLEAPARALLTHWPGHDGLLKWDVPVEEIGEDSAIVLYWNEKELKPGEKRELGFSYGLGNVAGGGLGLTCGGSFVLNQELAIVAYVSDPRVNSKLKLTVPDSIRLSRSTPTEQPVPPPPPGVNRPSLVTWRVVPSASGTFRIRVESLTNQRERPLEQRITIQPTPIF